MFPKIFDVGYYVYEDFLTNDSATDANVGKNLWEIDAISGGADTLTYETDQGETFLRMTGGGAGDGDGTALSLADDKVTLGNAGGFFASRVRYPDITGNALANNNFRIGLTDVVDSSEPVVGVWFDSNAAVMEGDVASANGDSNVALDHPDLTSNTTLVLGTIYNLECRWSGDNANSDPGPDLVVFYIDGHMSGKIDGALIDGAETVEPKITHWADTGGASTLELDVFGYELGSYLVK